MNNCGELRSDIIIGCASRNAGVRVSGGDLCRKAEAPTEPTGETVVPYDLSF